MIREKDRTDALASLCPGAEWAMSDGEITYWAETNSVPQPSYEDLDAELARLQALPPEVPFDPKVEIEALKAVLVTKGAITLQEVEAVKADAISEIAVEKAK